MVTALEFITIFSTRKLRIPGLSWGIVCVMTRLIFLIELLLVTDEQQQGHSIYRATIASRGKK